MKWGLTHTTDPAGKATLAQAAGSSGLGFFSVTSSNTVTRSPFLRWVTISLLMAAWPRTLTFFSLGTAGPGTSPAGMTGGAVFAEPGGGVVWAKRVPAAKPMESRAGGNIRCFIFITGESRDLFSGAVNIQ